MRAKGEDMHLRSRIEVALGEIGGRGGEVCAKIKVGA